VYDDESTVRDMEAVISPTACATRANRPSGSHQTDRSGR
jgi:hypothetical protein